LANSGGGQGETVRCTFVGLVSKAVDYEEEEKEEEESAIGFPLFELIFKSSFILRI